MAKGLVISHAGLKKSGRQRGIFRVAGHDNTLSFGYRSAGIGDLPAVYRGKPMSVIRRSIGREDCRISNALGPSAASSAR